MAGITISSKTSSFLNPTNLFIPVRDGFAFADSLLYQNDAGNIIQSDTFGFTVNKNDLFTIVGDYDGVSNQTKLTIDDLNQTVEIYSNGILRLNVGTNGILFIDGTGVISGSAGLLSGDYLAVTINGNEYKIQLLNP